MASLHSHSNVAHERVRRSASLSQYAWTYLARALRTVMPASSAVSARDSQTRRRRRRPPRFTADELVPEGEHGIVLIAGKLRCVGCLRVTKMAKTLRAAPCWPAVGHRLWSIGPFTFCGVCGTHSCDKAQLLAADCRGQSARGTIGRVRLHRLWEGCHP